MGSALFTVPVTEADVPLWFTVASTNCRRPALADGVKTRRLKGRKRGSARRFPALAFVVSKGSIPTAGIVNTAAPGALARCSRPLWGGETFAARRTKPRRSCMSVVIADLGPWLGLVGAL